MSTLRLEGKVAIITGGTSGMGRAAAELFSKEGAKVAIAGRRIEKGEMVADGIRKKGGSAIFVQTDVSNTEDVKKLIEKTISEYGTIDVLFNNAGINNSGEGDPHNEDELLYDEIMGINLKGAFLCTKYVVPHMIKGGGGSIINNSSVLDSLVADSSSTSYHVSKGGLKMLTKKCAVAYASDNIRCNSIQPGAIATEMSLVPWDNLEDPDVIQGRERMQPLVRMGHPNDVAFAALYFASDESAFVTGAERLVDGGQSVKYK